MSSFCICQICNSSFKKTSGSKGLYCSRSCSTIGSKQTWAHKSEKTKTLSSSVYCLQCLTLITSKNAKKFCCASCSTTYNNLRRVYPKKEPSKCLACNKLLCDASRKYCSNACQGLLRQINDLAYKRKLVAAAQSRYRAKKLRKTHPSANHLKIKEIYLNCPPGHEVDHIIPLSRGGLHHEDNLQYLTIRENRKKGNRYI